MSHERRWAPCYLCQGTGTVLALKRDYLLGSAFAFACSCDEGRKWPAYPSWRQELREQFVPRWEHLMAERRMKEDPTCVP